MSRLRIWWCRAILGHYVTEFEYRLCTDYWCDTCKRRWKLANR